MMSSDLLITSGSSFSFVAATMSYKPVVLFDRPKEGFYFGVYMDYDYVRSEAHLSDIPPQPMLPLSSHKGSALKHFLCTFVPACSSNETFTAHRPYD